MSENTLSHAFVSEGEVFMTTHTIGIRHIQQTVAAPNGKAPSASPDDHSHHPALPDLAHLRALSQERPSRKMALIRRSWPDILTALKAGHSLKRVCERLNGDGIPIGYMTLCSYVNRLRRERR
jgi:hypothetical protein